MNIYKDMFDKEKKDQDRRELEAKHKKLRKSSNYEGKLTIIDLGWFILIVAALTGVPILLAQWFVSK